MTGLADRRWEDYENYHLVFIVYQLLSDTLSHMRNFNKVLHDDYF